MAQITFVDGDYPTAADLNTYCAGEGGAWTSWTPTITQSGSVAFTNTGSRYARYGRTIHASFYMTVTGSGTGANNIVISLPVTAAAGFCAFGVGVLFDTSATTSSTFVVVNTSTTQFSLAATALSVASSAPYLGSWGFTAGLAAGDIIRGGLTYEAAS